ncbi:RNA polymerase sigma-32 factor [Caulobacter ginsengisoli]|uniref:RNA polymerase sigma-32 factor n=1 Tax=Caulobacter ginsengisoli TaxID=400775 RepID=A0ABU0IQF1_9CAUL|nr:RNA polymerase factor sigma-32 [Caulobacter ginsengisoli]MDQ0464243.1 RNA polymerase sigma-32 factor [Caulobacter ginsengisoli]
MAEPITSDTADRRFIRRAMRAPLLSADHEQDLAVRWREAGDDGALHELTEAYMRLVIAMASRFRAYGLPMSDLVQEGAVGLMQAAERFEPSRAVRFSTYAGWWIRAAMQDYVMRNWSIVRAAPTAAGKSLFFNLRRLRARLGALEGSLTPDQRQAIAVELGVEEDEVASMAMRLAAGDRSLSTPISDDSAESWQDLIVDEAGSPEQQVSDHLDGQTRERVLALALKTLTPREREIIQARRLSEEPCTLEALGAQMGVSKERVRQIEQQALGRLREAIRAEVGDEALSGLV